MSGRRIRSLRRHHRKRLRRQERVVRRSFRPRLEELEQRLALAGITAVGGHGGSTSFEVAFAPSRDEYRTATVQIGNHDADENPFEFAIRGTGVAPAAPEIVVLGNGNPIEHGDSDPRLEDGTDFGPLEVDGADRRHVFTVRNLGGEPLRLDGTPRVELLGPHASDFSIISSPDSWIAAHSQESLVIEFDPSAPGARMATISIENTDADETRYQFAVSGYGATAATDLKIDISSGVAALQREVVAYTITVRNRGPLGVSGATVANYLPTQLVGRNLTSIATYGGASTSVNSGGFSGPLLDTVDLPVDSRIVYTVSATPRGPEVPPSGQTIVTNVATVTAPAEIADTKPNNNRSQEFDLLFSAAIPSSGFFSEGAQFADGHSAAVDLGDLDGDHDLDAFVARVSSAGNRVWLNDGQGNFTATHQGLGDDTATDVALGDVDSDGDLDAFVTNSNTHNSVWLNSGYGTFVWDQVPGFFDSRAVALGDVDRDGDLDAVVVNRSSGHDLMENDGNGNFTDEGGLYGDHNGEDVALGDMDGDGDLDAVVVTSIYNSTQNNRIWVNDGRGHFRIGTHIFGDHDSRSVAIGDLDADGDLDAYVANSDADRVWLNDGAGKLVGTPQTLTDRAGGDVNLGDLDGDGDLDVLIAGGAIRFNDGAGNFTSSPQSPLGRGGSLGDLDGDGDFDAFLAGDGSINRVWVNQAAEIKVLGGSAAIAQGDAIPGTSDGTDFGTLGVLGGRRTHSFTIESAGAGGLLLLGAPTIEVVGPHAADFEVTPPPSEVPAGTTAAFEVTFDPSGVGLRSATVSIPNNDPDQRPFEFAIQGTGAMAPEINLRGNGASIADGDDTPTTADFTEFGVAGIDDGSITRTFTIENTGSAELHLGTPPFVNIGGAHAADFTLTASPSTPLAPGQGTNFAITFDPAALGVRSATVVIANNDLDESPYHFAIQGTGEADVPQVLDLALAKTSHRVEVVQGRRSTYTLTVTNAGSVAVTEATVSDHFPPQLRDLRLTSVVVAGGATTSLHVGDFSSPLIDTVDLPTGGLIVYTVTANLATRGESHLAAETTVTNGATVSLPPGLVDDNPSNNHSYDGDLLQLGASRGSGMFADTAQHLVGGDTSHAALGDLDGDGDLDALLAFANRGGAIWLNDGGAAFNDTPQELGLGQITAVALGDLDGDGDLDALLTRSGNRTNEVWFNAGDGSFLGETQELGNANSFDAALGDLDGDGDLDAVIAGAGGDRIWLNSGTGTFVAGNQLVSQHTRAVTLGDLDGDGDLDLFSVGSTVSPSRVWLNDSDANFADTQQSLAGSHSYDASLGDIDGDGDLDAFVAKGNGLANLVLLNDGAGNFSRSSQALGNRQSHGGTLGDLDGDGDWDAWVASESGNTIWLNDGNGRFQVGDEDLGGSGFRDAAIGDLDGDGDLDAVAVGNGGNRVFLNQEPEIEVTGNGLSIASGDTTPRSADATDFGSQLVAGGIAVHRFSLQNAGTGALHLSGSPLVEIAGPHANDFSVTVFPITPIAAEGGSVEFEITFDPSQLGLRTATVSLANHDFDESNFEFAVQGFGDGNPAPEIDIRGNGLSITGGDTTPSLVDHTHFGNADPADGGVARTFLLVNIGSADLHLAGSPLVEITGPDAADFTLSQSPLTPIAHSGGSTTFEVTFDPQELGQRSATVSISNDDDDEDPFSFDIRGTGVVWPDLAITKTSAPVSVDAAEAVTYTIHVTNEGATSAAGATVHDTFPPELSDIRLAAIVTSGGASTSLGPGPLSGVLFDSVDLPAGSSVVYTISASLSGRPHRLAKPILTNIAIVQPPAGFLDADPTNNSDFDSDVVDLTAPSGRGLFTIDSQELGDHQSRDVSLGDLDGDGDLDAFVVLGIHGGHRIWLNNGTGTFTDSDQSLGEHAGSSVALGDLDGDGDLDAFVSQRGFEKPNRVWLNDGGGRFSDSQQRLGTRDSDAVDLGDVDGDGDLDAIVSNDDGSNRLWWNDGHGHFVDSSQSLGGRKTHDAALGDLDADGDLDVFQVNGGSGGNRVWLNDGAGNFAHNTQNLGDHYSQAVELGDLDADGDLDAFVTSSGSHEIWLNDGWGTFVASGQFLVSQSTSDLAVGDLDADGDLDALVTSWRNVNEVWLNDGSGIFSAGPQSFENHDTRALALGDLDADGDLDAFMANYDGQADRLWLNQQPEIELHGSGISIPHGDTTPNLADGTDFGQLDVDASDVVHEFTISNRGGARLQLTGSPTVQISGPHAADFTVESLPSPSIHVDTTFSIRFNPSELGLRTATISIPNDDLDEDPFEFAVSGSGMLTTDLAITKSGAAVTLRDGQTVIYALTATNNGPLDVSGAAVADQFPRQLTGFVLIDVSVTDGAASSLTAGSFAGPLNDLVDLAAGSSIVYTVSAELALSGPRDFVPGTILTNTATITVPAGFLDGDPLNNRDSDSDTLELVVAASSGGFAGNSSVHSSSNRDAALGDLNGDGHLDAMFAGNRGAAAFLGDGLGSFSSRASLGDHASRHVALGDLDGDGDLDAVIASAADQPNTVWLNQGDGTFGPAQYLGHTSNNGVALGDLDGDGDIDAFVAKSGANRVWQNQGDGTFVDSFQELGTSPSTDVSLGDLDNDGDLDAFVANGDANRVWFNQGNGVFQDSLQLLGNNASRQVALGDLDNDGDLDAFVANGAWWTEAANRVWLNDGSGFFTDTNQSLGTSGSEGLSLGDLDGDGDLDAFVANDETGRGAPDRVWWNEGNAVFTGSVQDFGEAKSRSVALGDLDGDGDLDAIVGVYNDHSRVWLNEYPEIDVQGNSLSILAGDSTPSLADHTDFGSVELLAHSLTRTFSIENTGVGPLILAGDPFVEIVGDQAADFMLTRLGEVVVERGDTTEFEITFDPSAVGLRSATLRVANNDQDEAAYEFAIQGVGILAPEIDIRGNELSIPDGDGTVSEEDGTYFGTADVIFDQIAHSFTIHNLGSAPLELTGDPLVEISGANPAAFTVTVLPAATVPSLGSTTFEITFDPVVSEGFLSAHVNVATNDADESPYDFFIRGRATQFPVTDVQGNGISIPYTDDSPTLADGTDFGEIDIGGEMALQTFSIINSGSSPLFLTNDPPIRITGLHRSDFTVVSIPSSPVPSQGGTTEFTIGFDPSAVGERTAIIRIQDSDPTHVDYWFEIRGTGVSAPRIDVQGRGVSIIDGDTTPSSSDGTDFGTIDTLAGGEARLFTIANLGSAPLNLVGSPQLEILGPHAADFAVTVLPTTPIAAAGGEATFEITFSPSAVGLRTASISIANDDPHQTPYNFAIEGTGSDSAPPTALLVDPIDGGAIHVVALNERHYIDISYADAGGAGLDEATITDPSPEFSLSGSAAAAVIVDGAPTWREGSTYRYSFSGEFSAGQVTVVFDSGSWSDQQGNGNASLTQSFLAAGGAVPISPSVFVSTRDNGNVRGVRFRDEDILRYDTGTSSWSMFFDGSDVGVRGDIDALLVMANGHILISFAAEVSLGSLGLIDDSDIVEFAPTSTGRLTSGSFSLFLDGSDVGLDASSEDLDVIAIAPDGRLVVSTSGSFSVAGLSGKDEDLLVFNASAFGASSSGSFDLYLDGSDADLVERNEDTSGGWIDSNGEVYLTTELGLFSVPDLAGDASDVFICNPASLGADTSCSFSPYLDGSLIGLGGHAVDAFSLSGGNQLRSLEPVIYASTRSNGVVQGMSFRDEDILRYDPTTSAWSIYFDGSDVGIRGDVDALLVLPNGHILMSFSDEVLLSGVGLVDDSDVVEFAPTSSGRLTRGSFTMLLDGSDVGLSDPGEDIDALATTPDGRLLISTLGGFSVDGLSGKDEDLLVLNATQFGDASRGTFALYFDGSDVDLKAAAEDASGAWIAETGQVYLTTKANFAVPGLSGDGADLFVCDPSSLGSATHCQFSLFFDGSAHGLAGEVLDGFSVSHRSTLGAAAGRLSAAFSRQPDQLAETRRSQHIVLESIWWSAREIEMLGGAIYDVISSADFPRLHYSARGQTDQHGPAASIEFAAAVRPARSPLGFAEPLIWPGPGRQGDTSRLPPADWQLLATISEPILCLPLGGEGLFDLDMASE